jgi:signal transduction histidine kinase
MPNKSWMQRFPFHVIGGLIRFAVEALMLIKTNVQRSIRIQLMLTFAVCALAAFIVYVVSTNIFGEVTQTTYLDYSNRSGYVRNQADDAVSRLEELGRAYAQGNHGDQAAPAQPDGGTVSAPAAAKDRPPSEAAADAGANALPAAAVPARPAPSAEPAPPAAGTPAPATPAASAAQPQAFAARLDSSLRRTFDDFNNDSRLKMMLIDMDGNVRYKNKYVPETHVDVFSLLSNVDEDRRRQGEQTVIRPVEVDGRRLLLVASGFEDPTIVTRKGQSPLSLLAAVLAFVVLFYWMTRKKMRSIEELADGMTQIARGNLEHRVAERSKDEIGSLATHINLMAGELQRTIEEERRAERTKNELITNVSHDLRTPLTLIMGYLRLLKDKNYEGPEQAEQYLQISYGKAEKLKQLIEDLFEYTKLSNHDVPLRLETVSLNELIEQLAEELVTVAENERLFLSRSLPAEKVYVRMDPDKMIRVFENLLTNAIKYSLKPGEVRVRLLATERRALVCVANRGEPLGPEQLERLFDRFYRVDSSRSSETGGSGLGLAIAKSIVEAHDGRIWAESDQGEIRFWVELPLAM